MDRVLKQGSAPPSIIHCEKMAAIYDTFGFSIVIIFVMPFCDNLDF